MSLKWLTIGMLAFAATMVEAQLTAEKQVKLKTQKQLKAMFRDLNIDVPPGASRDEITELAVKEDLVNKWEAANPDKAKPKYTNSGPPPGMPPSQPGYPPFVQIWSMMDADDDGCLSREEILAQANPEYSGDQYQRQIYAQMDANGDGCASKPEAKIFFEKMEEERIAHEANGGDSGQQQQQQQQQQQGGGRQQQRQVQEEEHSHSPTRRRNKDEM
jgi:hypothetical protein